VGTDELQYWEHWLVESLGVSDPELVARLLKICVLTELLFHGDCQTAKQWLKHPAYAFKEESPLERSMTEEGAQEVETLICRIRQGIPT